MRTPFNVDEVINRTLRTSVLIDAFWDRWIVHGFPYAEIEAVRSKLHTLQNWTQVWSTLAAKQEKLAQQLKEQHFLTEADKVYRTASLTYNLLQWIYPERNEDKMKAYKSCTRLFRLADECSEIETRYEAIEIEGVLCPGRVRLPNDPIGCVIIVNPIDSTKEELYQYELDFLDQGFVTVSFDGPGQGETYISNGLRGTKDRWEMFVNLVIEYAAKQFPKLPLNLFGTSLGASWAIYGSCHPFIYKTVAVSPAVEFDRLQLPGYFLERMDCSCTLVPEKRAIPNFKELHFRSPVYLFHGGKDLMVPGKDINDLFHRLPKGKKWMAYEDEGHCCNYKLGEIRREASRWFSGEGEEAKS
ncbi:alpha/beta hydrolase [Paenibacillus physcomitrellae]|uniref:Serine aminopeptidase S33 domain-containing protein n=1 Tax=Paenibacillus physcomitrellae TaxID=1619311 RepID=A0ABQ1FSV5_9BACL|nr:alpha/beta hydrolase [Paenibacillus physcomitrellae]GGA29710.1 hypothetical protein GCM10010917_13440 [Paenibacillus physcomitrellae]